MKKNIIIATISVIVTILIIVGSSYAVFQKTFASENENKVVATNCLDVSVNGGSNIISLNGAYPMSDTDGLSRTPYSFSITNNCEENYVAVDISIKLLEGTTLETDKIKIAMNKKYEKPKSSLLSSYESNNYIVLNDGINANSTNYYEYRMWLDESATNSDSGKIANIEIAANATIKTDEPHGWSNSESGSLLYALRNNNEITDPVTTPGAEVSLETEAVLASTEDDYGTSYYYRGNVQNNYIVFANKCWRIVRVTGDGSIKLILHNNDGTNCNISDNTLNFAKYDGTNYLTAFNEDADVYLYNAGIGFMYGTPNSETYDEEHANLHDSTILSNLKAWYDLNGTFTKKEKDLLADVIWCNDKSTYQSGIKQVKSYYGSTRLHSSATEEPTLVCPNANGTNKKLSKFTAFDITNGNGDLKGYKIGLITGDEIVFAGHKYGISNNNIYLYDLITIANEYITSWALTPYRYTNLSNNSGNLRARIFANYLGIGNANAERPLRPSIALISSVKITNTNQTGTASNPYIISEN